MFVTLTKNVRLALGHRLFSCGCLVFFVLRYLWAGLVPLGNDEVYYWDWGRGLALSYVDHPPGVAWLAFLASQVFDGPLAARGLIPVLHLLATLCLAACLPLLRQDRDEVPLSDYLALMVITQLVPVLSLGGFMLVPDAGLLFAMSLALFILVYLLQSASRLTFVDGVWLGLSLGFAGLFKYHAAPIAAALLGALLWYRRRELRDDALFWLALMISGLVITLPVWVWNYQHDFASFRFQGSHGFGNLSLQPLAALRSFAGLALMLTPWFFWQFMALFWRKRRLSQQVDSKLYHMLLMGGLPLCLLLFGITWFKQVLPHWFVPAIWVLVPVLALSLRVKTRRARVNIGLAAFLTLALPSFFAVKQARLSLLDLLDYKPGALAELTLWPHLAAALENHDRLGRLRANPLEQPEHCPQDYAIAATRWYMTAQLAFHLEGQPQVYNFDRDHDSYYRYRDGAQTGLEGCLVVLVGPYKHLKKSKYRSLLQNPELHPLEVAFHDDQRLGFLMGIKNQENLISQHQRMSQSL